MRDAITLGHVTRSTRLVDVPRNLAARCPIPTLLTAMFIINWFWDVLAQLGELALL